ncbi:peptide chain release factor N(5)-glutamine methyltransferase [Cohaesibacter gelatinilyticus]|uniref:Release factor glutamine methyltransferase n=1 Tax=Cohaesibacter gelatinilyticus TaxID=372072 RepID=A0A285PHB5_9HYPH|nr:peptide chain release factor N(5)-glutamine methyltransferase [Cohaesibacter gelatinilyticus]SNZ20808.1 [protein release factor]-glutamine N5-methyltransferase [Cohaesibacter gelatinilyticus]
MRLDQAIAHWAEAFRQMEIETAKLDARLIVQHALNLSDMDMLVQFDRHLSEQDQKVVAKLAERRLKREPVAHLLGYREFWGLNFAVSGDVLVPRADSETLIEAVLADIPDCKAPLKLVDIGTGSGCLLLALLSELPNAVGIGVDMSTSALNIARRNARNLNLTDRCLFVRGDFATAFAGSIDVLISNPPYLAEEEFGGLDVDVANYDPYSALVSGPSGLEAYEQILDQIGAWGRPLPSVYLEIGYQQGEALQALALCNKAVSVRIKQDLGGRDRVVTISYE